MVMLAEGDGMLSSNPSFVASALLEAAGPTLLSILLYCTEGLKCVQGETANPEVTKTATITSVRHKTRLLFFLAIIYNPLANAGVMAGN